MNELKIYCVLIQLGLTYVIIGISKCISSQGAFVLTIATIGVIGGLIDMVIDRYSNCNISLLTCLFWPLTLIWIFSRISEDEEADSL